MEKNNDVFVRDRMGSPAWEVMQSAVSLAVVCGLHLVLDYAFLITPIAWRSSYSCTHALTPGSCPVQPVSCSAVLVMAVQLQWSSRGN